MADQGAVGKAGPGPNLKKYLEKRLSGKLKEYILFIL